MSLAEAAVCYKTTTEHTSNWISENQSMMSQTATRQSRSSLPTSARIVLPSNSSNQPADQTKEDLNRKTNTCQRKENTKLIVGLAEPNDKSGGPSTCQSSKVLEDCGRCNCCENGRCGKLCFSNKRRFSTSMLNMKGGEVFTNANAVPLKRANTGAGIGAARSIEKIDKINLANLVFNPHFKNSAGGVNYPIIRAGQNLAHKNAQRSMEDLKFKTATELNQITQQAAIDLITQQLQPQGIKLNMKLQQISEQRKLKVGSTCNLDEVDVEDNPEVGGVIHTFTGKSQPPSQSNALRYKTELCRSHEEGGECRFGSACTFAHGSTELRPVPRHPLYKTEMCRTYHQHGYCQYGTRCHFIHDNEDADASAPLRGCKSWGRHDQLSGALLSLASSSGILPPSADPQTGIHPGASTAENDVLLANLRRLYAMRMMNGQDKISDQSRHPFSMTQPISQQITLSQQQQINSLSANQHLPLSMTQPLPMDALQMGLQRGGGHIGSHMGPMGTNTRVESLANDYTNWVTPPLSPTFSGLSPFGSYQQFSPLPHHQAHPQTYPHYPFSATAPDLSAALNASPYAMSPPAFSNTVNLGQVFDQNGNYQQQAPASNSGKANQIPVNAPTANMHGYTSVPNPMWPPTSAEVSSVIDRELFGFGLDTNQQPNAYQQHYQPYFNNMSSQQQTKVNRQPLLNPSIASLAPLQDDKYEVDLLGLSKEGNERLMPVIEANTPEEQSDLTKVKNTKSREV